MGGYCSLETGRSSPSPPPAGRRPRARRPPPPVVLHCGQEKGEMKGLWGFQGSSGLYTSRSRRVDFRPSIWRSTAAMKRQPRGLNSAQGGDGAGPPGRPSHWLLGLEPMRAQVDGRGPVFRNWAVSVCCEQYHFSI
jgi:hypothetical protein